MGCLLADARMGNSGEMRTESGRFQEARGIIMVRKTGMPQQEYEDAVNDDVYRFIVRPIIPLFGIYIVSTLLEIFLDMNYEYFKIIFTGIGGIPYLIYYYRKELA